MENLFYLIKSLIKNTNLIGGAIFCFFVISIFALFRIKLSEGFSRLSERFLKYTIPAFFAAYILIGIVYIFYPNYLSHIEPTIASLGGIVRSGDFLYPLPLGTYPYYGILYGPALFEIQMVFQGLGLSTIVASKLPGLLAFILTVMILFRLNKGWLYRGYLLYLLPFGLMLFFNRSESFLLFIVSLSLIIGKSCPDSKYLPIYIGILGGAASALKIHGVAYVFAAFLAVTLPSGLSIYSILLFSIFSVLSFFVFFIPHNVSFLAFWGYLKLASQHGLSLKLWLEDLTYIIFLLFPLFFIRKVKIEKNAKKKIIMILGVELCVTIIATKPGTGFYHLLPFIPVNALMFQKIFGEVLNRKNLIRVLCMSLIFVSLTTIVFEFFLPMAKSWHQFNDAQKEIVYFKNKYQNILMGVTDDNGYPYSFLRVMLKGEQIDYAAFMDLHLSGIGDDIFVERLKSCKIDHILLSNIGEPFMLNNYYTLKPLFSNAVRETFIKKYFLVEKGKKYSVYRCLDKK